jgi:predicted transcriptional regulator
MSCYSENKTVGSRKERLLDYEMTFFSRKARERMQEKVGSAAGQIWKMLAAAKGPVNITDIPKRTKLSSQIAFQGLGWLAREGKLEYQQKGRSIYVCLTSSECCLQ